MRRVLVASAIAHIAIFAVVARVEPRPVEPPAPPTYEPIEGAIELVPDLDRVPEPTPTAAPPQPAFATAGSDGGSAATPRVEPAPAQAAVAPVSSAEPAPYASNGTWIVSPLSLGIAATGDRNPFIGRVDGGAGGAAASSADPMSVPLHKRAEQAMKDALRARDHAVGLGPEGPVVTALEDAAHAGFSPERGIATFLAVIDERGLVIDLKLMKTNASDKSGERGWEDVRQRAVKSLATAKIEMRGVKRAELTIEVESKVVLPDGRDPQKQGPVKPVAEPTAVITRSEAPASPSGADAVAGAKVATFDLSNIGAKVQRVVHAKLVTIKSL